MFTNNYHNFVRPTDVANSSNHIQRNLSGEEARRIYLEEIEKVEIPTPAVNNVTTIQTNKNKRKRNIGEIKLSNKNLFLIVQNDEVDILKRVLDDNPDKINLLDDYGWSLLMIACQANSIETVKELLRRGANTFVRDKAGNSARSLIIKSRNLVLADLFINHQHKVNEIENNIQLKKVKLKEEFQCVICGNKTFPDKEEHLSSTIHNINACKGKKIPTNYVIPETNKGYQIMVKVGWDKESGLGPEGTGNKYPIKAIQKKDKKGLGLEKRQRKEEVNIETVRHVNKKLLAKDYQSNRKMEINFRREFY